jgi:hypothetical protein
MKKLAEQAIDLKALEEARQTGTQQGLEETAKKAEDTYQAMINSGVQFDEKTRKHFEDTATAARLAADNWGTAFGGALDAISAKVAAETLSWSEAMDQVTAGKGTMSGTVPVGGPFQATQSEIMTAWSQHKYFGPVDEHGMPDWTKIGFKAEGGPVTAGAPYLVGEQGPELFVPSQSGGIVPNGAGGGTVVANIYVNGTGADVARVINAELTRMMRVGRKWPSV